MGVMAPGDEVIVPANTYIASILAITECGLKPVLIEPKFDTLQINEDLIENAINDLHLDGTDPAKDAFARVSELGDSSVNFKLYVWTEALMRGVVTSQVLTAIYDTLNENNIEIPFPQQDVHIKN
jgi:small-conductance mechanosensitive channel